MAPGCVIKTVVTRARLKGRRSDPGWESAYFHDSDRRLSAIHIFEDPMSRKRMSNNKKVTLPMLNPDAAGIDIGATEIYVAVLPDRDTEPVRMFAISPRI